MAASARLLFCVRDTLSRESSTKVQYGQRKQTVKSSRPRGRPARPAPRKVANQDVSRVASIRITPRRSFMEAVHGSMLLIYAVIAIAALILMITRFKVYPFLVLIIVSLLLRSEEHTSE